MPKFTRSKLVQKDDQFLIWEYRGLRVVLDRKRVVPNDPGQDTPALVHYKCAKYRACSTYWCACGEGELLIEGSGGVHKLTENQLEWLESLDPELTDFLYNTKGAIDAGVALECGLGVLEIIAGVME